jgi:hypothetical protein
MGSALTTFGQDPIPATNDGVLIPADVSQYAEAIAHKIIHFVADQADRDVQLASAAAPVFAACPTAVWFKISGSGGGSVWVTIWQDTGPVVSGVVAATDFDYSSGYVRKFNGGFAFLELEMTRRNSAITAASSGNITGDPPAFTVPVGFRPDRKINGVWRSDITEGTWRMDTDGVGRIMSGNPSQSIPIDTLVEFTAGYVTA